ncbi:hypothetical protein PHJA_001935300 [Phtheirospermum japonicum]|uniref:Uncharacterized protein n=1 Tax=Phtheirospermum japonicum TaxID=374723 RepID=A0A830CI52_9LAMI|nr:hypothetical protein PHJA_001935300 [Phtheirospermum japonicum]
MSTILSYFLVVVLLCFSFHACNARSYGVIPNQTPEKFQHSITKENNPNSINTELIEARKHIPTDLVKDSDTTENEPPSNYVSSREVSEGRLTPAQCRKVKPKGSLERFD